LNTRNGRLEIHRHVHARVARDALHVAERLFHRLAERNADILGRMMVVDVQVALGPHADVDARMTRQQIEHVIEEANAGRDLGRAGAIEVHRHLDVGFLGLSSHRALAHHHPHQFAALLSGVSRLRHHGTGVQALPSSSLG
jgi:hypothetical protein